MKASSSGRPPFRVHGLTRALLSVACMVLVGTRVAHANPSGSVAAQPAAVRTVKAPTVGASAQWNGLTPAQQAALKPLESQWGSLPINQQRKWLEVAPGFAALPPQEKARVHERMGAWSALSPQQRANARLNFNEAAATLSPEERKAKWEAYKALSPEERQRLRAEGKAEQPKSMALAPKPIAPERLAAVPKPQTPASRQAGVTGNQTPGKGRAKIAVASTAVPSAE